MPFLKLCKDLKLLTQFLYLLWFYYDFYFISPFYNFKAVSISPTLCGFGIMLFIMFPYSYFNFCRITPNFNNVCSLSFSLPPSLALIL